MRGVATYVVRGVKKIAGPYDKFQYEVDIDLIGHMDKNNLPTKKPKKKKDAVA